MRRMTAKGLRDVIDRDLADYREEICAALEHRELLLGIIREALALTDGRSKEAVEFRLAYYDRTGKGPSSGDFLDAIREKLLEAKL